MIEQKTGNVSEQIDLTEEGVVENLVRNGRSPVFLPGQINVEMPDGVLVRDVVYCHIPPPGTIFKDNLFVAGGNIQFFDSDGKSRGETKRIVLRPETAEVIKERRNAELRDVSRERREALGLQPLRLNMGPGGIR